MFRVDGIFILKNKEDFENREVSKKLVWCFVDLKIYILTYLNIKIPNKYCKNYKEFKNSKKNRKRRMSEWNKSIYNLEHLLKYW